MNYSNKIIIYKFSLKMSLSTTEEKKYRQKQPTEVFCKKGRTRKVALRPWGGAQTQDHVKGP